MTHTIDLTWLALVLAALGAALVLHRLVRWSFVAARPDEWLLRVRNGKLLDAGIGITLWRVPGDTIARFSSTIQRVKFAGEAYTREHVAVSVEGFALWTVSAETDGPFRAFSRLGIANLDRPTRELKSDKHLLTSPQYRAFQALLATELGRQVAALTLEDVLSDHGKLATSLHAGLQELCATLGIVMTQVELSQARPLDRSVLHDMAAEPEEAVKERAARVRVQSTERRAQVEIESATRTAHEQARARADRERAEATATLELQRAKAELFAAQVELDRRRLEEERELTLARIESELEVERRRAHVRREAELTAEQTAHEVARARLAREELDLVAALDRTRREAAASRDAMLERTRAEEQKSQPVRDHELARHVTDRVAASMASMRESRWISIGGDSPFGAIAGVAESVRQLLAHGVANDGGSPGATGAGG